MLFPTGVLTLLNGWWIGSSSGCAQFSLGGALFQVHADCGDRFVFQ